MKNNDENLYKINKIIFDDTSITTINNKNYFLHFIYNEGTTIIDNKINPIFIYNSNKTYFEIDINHIINENNWTDQVNVNIIKNLFNLNNESVTVSMPKLGSRINSNFRFLNYDTNSGNSQSINNINIKLLIRSKTNYMNDYEEKQIVLNNNIFNIEIFKYIDILLNSDNKYYSVNIQNQNNQTNIKYKILNDDIDYQNLEEYEKYKYQVELFLSKFNSNPHNFLCSEDYFMNNIDNHIGDENYNIYNITNTTKISDEE